MNTITGTLLSAYAEPAALPNPATGDLEIRDQLNINLRGAADEKQYGFTMPINEKTVALDKLNEWLDGAVEVTVFCSSARALPFVHEKDKTYTNRGRKVPVKGAKNTVVAEAEIDAFIAFSAFDVRPAGEVNLAEVAKAAHGDFLRQRAQMRKRNEQQKKEKARERAEQRIADDKSKRTQQAGQKKSA